MTSICIMVQMFFIVHNIPFCSVRFSNELGVGTAEAACFFYFFISVATYSIINIIFAIVFLFCKNVLGYLFTNSPSVAERVSELVPFLIASILLNGIQAVLSDKYLTSPLLMNFFILINYFLPGQLNNHAH